MILYKCDRCGKERGQYELFAVTITPPEVWNYYDSLVTYFSGELHFCTDCMEKIQECIDELGRNE